MPTPEAVAEAIAARGDAAVRPGPERPALATALGGRPDAATSQLRRVDIDLVRLRELGFVTPGAQKTQIADEFRVIKRPIIRTARTATASGARPTNLVMVTSALPGEGKTFTALNLAMSVAMELDSTVLLVDGDVAHPALPDLLGVPPSPGLLDLLTEGRVDVADALVKTNVEKLTVLPAGSRHRRATELLASEQMASLPARARHAIPGPGHHLRFPAAARDDGSARARDPHGAGRMSSSPPIRRRSAPSTTPSPRSRAARSC